MALVDFNLGDIGDLLKDARIAITGKDPEQQARILEQIATYEHELKMGQISINREEAKSSNWFVAAWRPSLGWIGSIAIGYTFLISPMIEWYCKIHGIDAVAPTIDTQMLFNLVLALLGFGGLRTVEKIKGIHNDH